MFLLSEAKAAVYVPDSHFDVMGKYKYQDYYKLNLSYDIVHQNIPINECRYLIWRKQIQQHYVLLTFFLIHDIEHVSQHKYRLFIQKYLEIDDWQNIKLFLQLFNLEDIVKTYIIDLYKLDLNSHIFSTNFKPFVTAIPVKYKIIGFNEAEISQQMIIDKVSNTFRNNFYNQINVEFKNNHSIILNTKTIIDDSNKFIVKKGVEYSVEFVDYETIWLNLSITNFSRTVKSVKNLGLKEPIDHNKHKLVNIRTGRPISRKVQNVSDIREPECVFDTFDSTEAFKQRCEHLRFSQQKFWVEQTNLQDTVELINDLQQNSNNQSRIASFADINKIKYRYKIIHRLQKYLFVNGELHHTSAKGLHNSGVLQMPENLEVKLLVSKCKLATEPLTKIISNINERLNFLYKKFVKPICEVDVIIFDYIHFSEELLASLLGKGQYSYIVHLIDAQEIQQHYNSQIEKINLTNTQLIEILKRNHLKFDILNSFEQNTLANSLLKLGLKNQAIPWKIKDVDPQDPHHIFIGIDLGHNHKDKLSNLTLTAIDNSGCLIKTYTGKKLKLNEVIPYEELLRAFRCILRQFQNHSQSITIHRDGLITKEELEYFHRVMREVRIEKYNLVEVIKSGVPRIGFYSNYQGKDIYLDGFTGYYIFANDISYLITNDQSLRRSTRTSPKPLKIKKKHGYKKITELTEEIYWLTKAYSINIFEPTSLPITTLLANNLSYSKNIMHFTTE